MSVIHRWEKRDGNSDKFYTMIEHGPNILCNYGINGGDDWHKQIIKPYSRWNDTAEDRRKHGYTSTYMGTIDSSRYLLHKEKLDALYAKIGDNPVILNISYYLAKYGEISKEQMRQANKLYLEGK